MKRFFGNSMADSWKNIVVGRGLAGINLAFELMLRGEDVHVIDPCPEVTSTSVAAGVYNPIVPRRQVLSWKAEELVPTLVNAYGGMEAWLGTRFLDHDLPIHHPINSEHHLDEWKRAIEQGAVSPFVERILESNSPLKSDVLGVVEVRNGGRILTRKLIEAFCSKLEAHGKLIRSDFQFDQLAIEGDALQYQSKNLERIFFCEGHRVTENPLFNWVPMKPSKGQVLSLKTDAELEKAVYSKRCFFVEDEPSVWKLGATFEWDDIHSWPDEAGKEDLLGRISDFMEIDTEVIDQEAAIRPTMHDRRPLIGRHPNHKNVFILNGLGTKGTMLAPWCAQQLCSHIFEGKEIDPEADIQRTFSKYYKTENG